MKQWEQVTLAEVHIDIKITTIHGEENLLLKQSPKGHDGVFIHGGFQDKTGHGAR